ncbi:MAG: hypothetical protein WCD37_00040 [Chloroflexia bacterium]
MAKQGGDSSFLIGLVLGLAVGAAIAIILTEVAREDTGPDRQLEKAKDRIEGAAEAAT